MDASSDRNPGFGSLVLQAFYKLVPAETSGLFRNFHCFGTISGDEITGFR
jgi:hypothetical protein